MRALKLYRNASALLMGGLLAVLTAGAIHALESGQTEDSTYRLTDSNSLYGSYLAGRLARSERDNETAAAYYREALEKDPASKEILEDAFQLKVATGDFKEALNLARKLYASESGHKVANFFLGISEFGKKRYGRADRHFKAGGKGPIMDLTANLARAWIDLARGRTSKAIKFASKPATPQTEAIELLHRAMIADLAGRRSVARTAYEALRAKSPRNMRAAEAFARHAAFGGDKELALDILKPHLATANPNPLLKSLHDEIVAGKKPALLVSTPQEGVAEVFQGIGEALSGDGVADAGQVYLQLALFVRPEFTVAQYTLGELYDQLKSYEQAAESFAQIPRSSPLWLNAQLRRSYDLSSLKRIDEAKDLLKEVIQVFPDDMRPYYTLGNMLRGNKEYREAVTYYTQALERLGRPDKAHWLVYYARGVCYERLKNWPKAEADLKKALELDSNQELTLNYLGYSWVDQNLNVKQAMELIRRAVKLRPNDGYFIDSLGWAYYRQENFALAVKHLERAVELKPDDPVINDHLGDAYWHVGRKLEAHYQWKQALDLKPEPEDALRIKKKLKTGLLEEPSTRAALDAPVGQPQAK